MIDEELTPFGFIDDGVSVHDATYVDNSGTLWSNEKTTNWGNDW
jgi:hypothetical protein